MADVDFKFMEHYCRDKLSRPFVRRFRYLYIGLERCDDLLVLSTTEDVDFKYCEPMQATGLVKIHNPEHLAKVRDWLLQYGIDGSIPYLFYFGAYTALFNKTAWTTMAEKITIHNGSHGEVWLSVDDGPQELIARPIDTYFTLTKLQHFVDKYTDVFFGHTIPTFQLTFDGMERLVKPTTLPISCQALYEANILVGPCQDVKLVLLPGLDVLAIKGIAQVDNVHVYGIKLWADGSPYCLNYGGFYSDVDVSLCVARDNIFIFPKVNLEQTG